LLTPLLPCRALAAVGSGSTPDRSLPGPPVQQQAGGPSVVLPCGSSGVVSMPVGASGLLAGMDRCQCVFNVLMWLGASCSTLRRGQL